MNAPLPRLCLNMIVKDEAAILERCLESLLPAIDAWAIVDTGSTDGTPELIRAFFSRHGIPGALQYRPFVDFATSRNEALDVCRALDVPFDYILLCDADMELRIDDPRFRERLGAGAYLLRQQNVISYDNVRLVRRDVEARYVGATHEYLGLPSPAARLEGLWFVDHACGSSRKEKFARDERLLLAELERDPGNVRAMYYLAQTYRDMGEHEKAARWYRARAAAGGWAEESWHALYSLALCLRRLDDHRGFVEAMTDAHRARPSRAEPLHELAKFHRERGDAERAAELALEASRIAYPADDRLFVEDFVYRDGIRHELSISGFYSRDPAIRARARRECLALAHDRETPAWCRDTARSNWIHYARSLADLVGGRLDSRRIDIESPPSWSPTNPSIALDGDRLRAVVRTVNYAIGADGSYSFPPGDRAIRTENVLATLERDGAVIASTVMADRASDPRHPSSVLGYEDCRLVRWRGAWWCTATVRDRSPDMRCEIALLSLADDGAIVSAEVLRGYGAHFHQKNWLPFVDGERLLLLYGADPTIVLEYRGPGDLAELSTAWCPFALEHLRGGGGPVRIDGGWLYVAHSVLPGGAGRRRYLHSFVRLTEELTVSAVSEPFYFESRDIEFAAGLAFDARTGRAWVSYGVADRSAAIAAFDLADLLAAPIWLGPPDAGAITRPRAE